MHNADYEGAIVEKNGVRYLQVDTGLIRITPRPPIQAGPEDVPLKKWDMVRHRGSNNRSYGTYMGPDSTGFSHLLWWREGGLEYCRHIDPAEAHTGVWEVIDIQLWENGRYVGPGSRQTELTAISSVGGWSNWLSMSGHDKRQLLEKLASSEKVNRQNDAI